MAAFAYIDAINYTLLDVYEFDDDAKVYVSDSHYYSDGIITEREFIDDFLMLTREFFTVSQIKSIIKAVADVNKEGCKPRFYRDDAELVSRIDPYSDRKIHTLVMVTPRMNFLIRYALTGEINNVNAQYVKH